MDNKEIFPRVISNDSGISDHESIHSDNDEDHDKQITAINHDGRECSGKEPI